MSEIYQDIPCWDNGSWTSVSFNSREEYANAIKEIFKEPGQYGFDETMKTYPQLRDKLQIVPHGVDTSAFHPLDKDTRKAIRQEGFGRSVGPTRTGSHGARMKVLKLSP